MPKGFGRWALCGVGQTARWVAPKKKAEGPGGRSAWWADGEASGHENRDESQQENQHSTGHGQDDGHEGNDGLHHILRLVFVAVVIVV